MFEYPIGGKDSSFSIFVIHRINVGGCEKGILNPNGCLLFTLPWLPALYFAPAAKRIPGGERDGLWMESSEILRPSMS